LVIVCCVGRMIVAIRDTNNLLTLPFGDDRCRRNNSRNFQVWDRQFVFMHAKLANPAIECSLMQEPMLTFSSHPLRGGAWLLRGCQLAICLGVLTEDWLWNATLSHFLLAPLQGRILHMVWSPHGHYRIYRGLTPCALTPLRYGRTLHPRRIEVHTASRVSPIS
jgi:hypothetical protein